MGSLGTDLQKKGGGLPGYRFAERGYEYKEAKFANIYIISGNSLLPMAFSSINEYQ